MAARTARVRGGSISVAHAAWCPKCAGAEPKVYRWLPLFPAMSGSSFNISRIVSAQPFLIVASLSSSKTLATTQNPSLWNSSAARCAKSGSKSGSTCSSEYESCVQCPTALLLAYTAIAMNGIPVQCHCSYDLEATDASVLLQVRAQCNHFRRVIRVLPAPTQLGPEGFVQRHLRRPDTRDADICSRSALLRTAWRAPPRESAAAGTI